MLLDAPTKAPPPWIATVPAFRVLKQHRALDFRAPVTILTGENGVGKSTLLEGIAISCHFNERGGPFGAQAAGRSNPLRDIADVVRSNRPMDGYFLRAESHFNVASDYGDSAPGVSNLHHMSHGESVMQVVQHAFHGNGLYLLDEPESGLSMIRQMALLAELHAVAQAGAQVIVATHSPVLLALPGAEIWEFGVDATFRRGVPVEATVPFRALRDFLDDPHGIADYMVGITDD
nr:AAA family ATPase [Corynebacterium pacaense]